MKKTQIIFIAFLILLFGCEKKPPKPNELYSTYRNSVVLIINSYYTEVELDNGIVIYFTFSGNDLNIHLDEDEAVKNTSYSYGTGFFISDKGEIATNRHVIYPSLTEEQDINAFVNELSLTREKYLTEFKKANDKQGEILEYIRVYKNYIDYSEILKLEREFEELQEYKELQRDIYNSLNFNPDNYNTKIKRVFLGVAYDNTFVNTISDFEECIPIKKSDDEDIDLAIIQLISKSTPSSVTNMISLDESLINSKPELSDDVYMIGFNYGINLAHTNLGIQSQFTHGTITQDPDGNRVLYSVPTLQGSSGSPIIDKWGNLVAINFAKVGETQSFNFGVPARYLIDLSNSDVEILPKNNIKANPPLENVTVKTDIKRVVRNFIDAEDERDFEKIYKYFSNDVVRYYNNYYPSYTDLKKSYEKSWNQTAYSSNEIITINMIDENNLNVNTVFTFFDNRTNRENKINSLLRFTLDEFGKITHIYKLN